MVERVGRERHGRNTDLRGLERLLEERPAGGRREGEGEQDKEGEKAFGDPHYRHPRSAGIPGGRSPFARSDHYRGPRGGGGGFFRPPAGPLPPPKGGDPPA